MSSSLPVAQATRQASVGSSDWFLCETTDSNGLARAVNVNSSPFRIGRLPGSTLCLSHTSVSKAHAELLFQGRELWVRDLGSTNGTFVNGRRIKDRTALHNSDLLQVASIVFRIEQRRANLCSQTIVENSADWARSLFQFERLMSGRAVVPHFQPIVDLDDLTTIGFESLDRSSVDGLEQPRSMFAAAEIFDQQCELSRLLRWEGVRMGRGLPEGTNLFVNTHPDEIVSEELVASLRELRKEFPAQRLTIEIPESAVTDIGVLTEFRSILRDLQIQLAFDDFGAGQARLLELTETSPDYVKFDMQMIRGINEASASRQHALAALVRMVRDLGIATLAEGVEMAEESTACRQLGFELAQGFYLGRPAPLAQ